MSLDERLSWWQDLRHEGLFLDTQRLRDLIGEDPQPLPGFQEQKLRRAITTLVDGDADDVGGFVELVLEHICGFAGAGGKWQRGSNVPTEWSRIGSTGESIRPRHLWTGSRGAVLPVFIDQSRRVGIGRGRRTVSQVLQWLRAGTERLALLTNGRQWRLIFTGLDFHASVEWDIDTWFEEGAPSRRLIGLRSLLTRDLWIPAEVDQPTPLLHAILDSRKGQSDLSTILGERVRQAVEILAQAHESVLHDRAAHIDNTDLYRASVRMIMRIVVTLFAEARELLPADNEIYHTAYGVRGLRDRLERDHVRSPARLSRSYSAWPHLLALFRLIHDGCAHEALPVPRYGGELFEPGDAESADGVSKGIRLFETACFDAEVMPDRDVHAILDLLTRTKVRIRQGRGSTLVAAPVNFAELDNEYIGILYEGLLDYELRAAPDDQPVVFLNVGDQPALPLATLESMDDESLKALLEKMKERGSAGDDEQAEAEGEETDTEDVADELEESNDTDAEEDEATAEEDGAEEATEGIRHTTRTRAETWARRACEVASLVRKPRGRMTPERQLQYDDSLAKTARRLVDRVILPREWYLVRWGGTRKGSGTFYTKPQLAIPTVHRTLRPLAYDPPAGKDGKPNVDAPPHQWIPKTPEAILALKVCDPACGSGSFPLAALRFLTDALYQSVVHHSRLDADPGRPVREILGLPAPKAVAENGDELLREEKLPCPPDDDRFEERFKAVLRRYVVERCIYGVDLDPLAAELCRLALWIETMDRELPFSFLDHKIRCGNSLVGAWFDQFLHYPVMAWEREGGDKNHSNGVHFKKEAITKTIRERKTKEVKPDLIDFIEHADLLFKPDLQGVQTVHDDAERALRALHELPVHEAEERSRRFRELRSTPEFEAIKRSFDFWCALWFWPGTKIDACPLPTEFAAPPDNAQETAREVAAALRFFHWELEFPDVFHVGRSGFDAVLGNPPWENLQPNPEEFFSNLNLMYRGMGQVEKQQWQSSVFASDVGTETRWLDYVGSFKSMSNWVKFAGRPFGDRVTENNQGRQSHDFNLGDRGRNSVESSRTRHARWKQHRKATTGYADADHPFRYQLGRLFTYKLFLEHAHCLLVDGGRVGFIVPSGLYSDAWSRPLRQLFIDRCRWEWLFGFENREKVFDIHRSFKFNPVIIARGGQTEAIRTAFMRRRLEDWEDAERFATDYPRGQVRQFSPNSLAVLEIQSQRDLQILTAIYNNSVLLGEQSENGWGIKYAIEFMMNTDAKLFPPRPKWEEWGYRPDEYSRWIKGPWKPIVELWRELGVDASRPERTEVQVPEWAFTTDSTVAEREATSLSVHGVTIRPGDVAHTDSVVRCAQPPYDTLPIPRADIPAGIILSREADAWLHEDDIPVVTFTGAGGKPLKIKVENEDGKKVEVEVRGPATALPLYEGRMIGQFDFSQKGWVSGKARSAEWREIPWHRKQIEPQYLIGQAVSAASRSVWSGSKIAYMRISSSTNSRTMIATYLHGHPAGDSVFFYLPTSDPLFTTIGVSATLSTLSYDFSVRARLGGLNMSEFVVNETPLPRPDAVRSSASLLLSIWSKLLLSNRVFSPEWIRVNKSLSVQDQVDRFTLAPADRFRKRCMLEAITAALFGLTESMFATILDESDVPRNGGEHRGNPKGFWRIDKGKAPEHRYTVLSLVAFQDLERHIETCRGDRDKGIESFLSQNDGEGWMLPEMLRLADYAMGHDDRAREHQPVRAHFGPRFYDWQLAQTPDESWRECHLHARNLLGAHGYARLIAQINGDDDEGEASEGAESRRAVALMDVEDAPLFESRGT